ncbi:hypothetical protein ACHQM5_014808 [Ranunculus cassubicifolius]
MDHCSNSFRDIASPFDCLLFDLDDTLYSSAIGIAAALKKNIDDFLVEKFGSSKDEASSLRIELFRKYGSTLAGLRARGNDISADEYHAFVHGRLPYEVIESNLQLRNLLRSIPQRKLIFTNSDRIHAIKVLEKLGLQDCFDQIICFETINPNLSNSRTVDEFPVLLKPSIDAMKIALNVANVDPCRTLFLDDNDRNISAGKSMGLRTALVGKGVKCRGADYAVENILNLRQVIPEIWAGGEDGGDHTLKRIGSEIDCVVLPAMPVGA